MRKFLEVVAVSVLLLLLVVNTAYGQSTAVSKGIQWISTQQSPEGYWGNPTTAPERDTGDIVEAINELDRTDLSTEVISGLERAAGWFKTRDVDNFDFLSRKARTLKIVGEDVSQYVEQLVNAQNYDGGWGLAKDFESSIPDTVQALKLIMTQQRQYETVVGKGVEYLLSQQNTEGSFSFNKGLEGDLEISSEIISLLSSLEDKNTVVKTGIENAKKWLMTQRQSDGGFGQASSEAKSTACAYYALIQSGASPVELSSTLQYLSDNQMENGSWDNDLITTALAVRAYKDAKANLVINKEDITFSNQNPIEGSGVTVTAKVKNFGAIKAENFSIEFYDGNPVSGGLLIGQKYVISSLLPGEETEVKNQWNVLTPGKKAVYIKVDSGSAVKESNEFDNIAYNTLNVLPLPDFKIEADDLSFSPRVPGNGEKVSITAFITNWSEGQALRAKVTFYSGDPDKGGVLIGEAAMPDIIEAWGTTKVSIQYAFNVGTHKVYAVVDPENEVAETDESNNKSWFEVQVPPKKDLEITNTDIIYSPLQPTQGETVKIAAVVKNSNIDTAKDVAVRFYDGDPKNNGVLIGEDLISQIDGGLTGQAQMNWDTQNKIGIHYIYVVVDEANIIVETNEGNNRAIVTIPVNYSSSSLNGIDLEINSQEIVLSPQTLLF